MFNVGIQERLPEVVNKIQEKHRKGEEISPFVSARRGRDRLQDLTLYNYTADAAFRKDSEWTDEERVCRGLVLDDEGNVVALPFPKFFNYSEHERDLYEQLLDGNMMVEDKADGSLGICFFHKGEWWVTTHGSLDSEQGIIATTMLRDMIEFNKSGETMKVDLTYLAEIIYPENRIVTDYGDDRYLVFLAAYDRVLLEECKVNSAMYHHAARVGFKGNKRNRGSLDEILRFCAESKTLHEGFVVVCSNGDRIKFKSATYLMAHKARFALTPKYIRELMLHDRDALKDFKKALPNEFMVDVDDIINTLDDYVFQNVLNHFSFYGGVIEVLDGIINKVWHEITDERKIKAEYVKICQKYCKENPAWNFHIMMTMWTMIRSGKAMSEVALSMERMLLQNADLKILFGGDDE